MDRQVRLSVSIQIQFAHLNAFLHRRLEYACGNVFSVAHHGPRKSDLHGNQSWDHCIPYRLATWLALMCLRHIRFALRVLDSNDIRVGNVSPTGVDKFLLGCLAFRFA
jgi:hypothetical protein